MPLFTNPAILLGINDTLIGCVEVKSDEIDFLNYTLLVENKILKEVIEYVREGVTMTGITHQESCKNTMALVRSYLNFPERYKTIGDTCDEETITKEIMSSFEYQNWENEIFNRFMELHLGVITKETHIPVGGNEEQDMSYLQSYGEGPLFTILDALISANTND